MSSDPLLQRAQALHAEWSALRRDLHRHPELAFQEQRTAEQGRAYFAALGLGVRERIAGTHGLVATLDSGRPGPTLMIRADMDALPIAEDSGAGSAAEQGYASEHPGVMHACGHDAHVTCALGAARLLSERRGELRGKVQIVLQPAEEAPPGGAQVLIDQGGILEGVDAAVALHVNPALPVGTVAFRSGQTLAFSDRFEITIKGVGAHAARPHLSVDAVAVAVQVYQALQYLVSRENDPLHPIVITIGSIHGGTAANVITDKVSLKGTVRCLEERRARQLPEHMERVVAGICSATRAQYEFHYLQGYPALVNDPALTERAAVSCRALLGEQAVRLLPRAEMGGEDFAFFSRKVPATMFRLGVRNEAKGLVNSLHSPKFDLDEDALAFGVAALARIALDFAAGG